MKPVEYMTVAIPRDESFDYPLLHALARARGLKLGNFIRQTIEERFAAEIEAHSQFANSIASMEQKSHQRNEEGA